jgi:lipopolysaccharide export system protein LptA
LLSIALLVTASPCPAQGLGLAAGRGEQPLTVEADDGIEWRRDQQVYIARGNARASRGPVTVHADVLTAKYRQDGGTGTEIHQIEAEGNVRIVSANETIYADRAVYDADQGVLVLTGKALKLVTREDVITARDSLEYWERRQLAVARGGATATRGDRRIRADVLSTELEEGRNQELKMKRVDAFGNVDVRRGDDVALANQGVYLAQSGLATLMGNVRMTRGPNQLNGEVAEINLNTGVSRLLRGPTGDQRVRGLFVPERGQPAKPPPPARTGG